MYFIYYNFVKLNNENLYPLVPMKSARKTILIHIDDFDTHEYDIFFVNYWDHNQIFMTLPPMSTRYFLIIIEIITRYLYRELYEEQIPVQTKDGCRDPVTD